jgi:ABC-2 type transport system permease protein
MHNTLLFARREYLETVRKKSFIVMTILLPTLMFGFTVLPSLMMTRKSGDVTKLVVATPDRQFASDIRDRIVAEDKSDQSKPATKRQSRELLRNFDVQIDTTVTPEEEQKLTDRVSSHDIDGYLWAPADAVAQRKVSYRSRSLGDFAGEGMLDSAIRNAILKQTMRKHGATDDEIAETLKPVSIQDLKVEKGRVTDQGGAGIFFTAILLMILLYTTMIMYGMSVMRSVIEEKNSRIFEVLLATATSKELMAGKILGAGAVGLTQISIWTVAAAALGGGAMTMAGQSVHLDLNLFNMLFFGLFFVLGFLLYSALSAALGASVNSEQEAQQLQFLVLMPLIISMVFMTPVITAPHSTLATVLSMIPFCAPLLMYIRILVETPPAWQIATSIALLMVTIWAMLAICSRIYRVGILMYGKRPTLPEMVKWLKYA